MTDPVYVASKLVTRLQTVSRNGNGMFGELCGQAAAEIQRLTADGESTRQSLHQVTAAYDALLKRMGAVREAVGTDPHFDPAGTRVEFKANLTGEIMRLTKALERIRVASRFPPETVEAARATGTAVYHECLKALHPVSVPETGSCVK